MPPRCVVGFRSLFIIFMLLNVNSQAPGACQTAQNRACWSGDFTIDIDYYAKAPEGVTREFDWTISEIDNVYGVVKDKVMLINNQLPGPVIYADWGDTIVVHLTNHLATNGEQADSSSGANGVTECPLAPDQSKTYTFKATQYGTSWYHSHFTAQYVNGVFGAIHINGPSTANYDIDLGVFPIFDYYYFTADDGVKRTQTNPIPPPSDNILFNGTNINPQNSSLGEYAVVTLTKGSKHRLRLVNPSIENHYQVSLVGHQFHVISVDFVPIEPLFTDTLFIGLGQRYDVIIDADSDMDSYWFNVTLSAVGLPSDPGSPPVDAFCNDRNDFVPYLPRNAPAEEFTPVVSTNDNLPVTLSIPPLSQTVSWQVNGSSIWVDWDLPVLDYVLAGEVDYPDRQNIVVVNEQDAWSFWVIQNLSPVPHPMHLHGHDYLVLGRSAPLNVALSLAELLALLPIGGLDGLTTTFDPSDIGTLQFDNPVRRDVTMLPALGYLVVAFKTDNPGDWLFHCHIAWHVSGGLSVDFVERRDEQARLIQDDDLASYEQVCAQWRDYYPASLSEQVDSGL
ncbi:multicopper oxidase [Xylariomycetidae sp. FL2044]|nr:multicopper oxidase [Xylariomycetidae sp. FL2044]